MNLKGSQKVGAPRDRVWEALNDPDVLRQCTPGCQQMVLSEDGSYDVVMEVGIAAVKGRYTGKIKMTDRIPGSQYKLAVNGSGSAGFMNAEGLIQLKELGDETMIEYSGQAHVGGLIAGVGQRIVEGVAKHLVGQFFKCFERAVLKSQAGGGAGPGPVREIS